MRPLTLHISSLTDAEYDLYTGVVSELCDVEGNKFKSDSAHYDHILINASEVRAWIRGRYAPSIGAGASDTDESCDKMTCEQLFAALRILVHVDAGREVQRGLAFIQALTEDNTSNTTRTSRTWNGAAPYEGVSFGVREARAWIRGRYAGIGVESTNTVSLTASTSSNSASISRDSPPLPEHHYTATNSPIQTSSAQVSSNIPVNELSPAQQKLLTAIARKPSSNHRPRAPSTPMQTNSQNIIQQHPRPIISIPTPPSPVSIESPSRSNASSSDSAPIIRDPPCLLEYHVPEDRMVTRSAMHSGSPPRMEQQTTHEKPSSRSGTSGSVVYAGRSNTNEKPHSMTETASRLRSYKSNEALSSIIRGNTKENFERLSDCWNETGFCLRCDEMNKTCVVEEPRYSGWSKSSCKSCRVYKEACWAPGEKELHDSLGVNLRLRPLKRSVPDDTSYSPSKKKARRT
ncbi:hypothetical protein BDQ17DRAFT_1371242 [Cyathus striatus]|nr:hypothetical protein BDQ17DRAFT_1371242 [Cyathus striatus]